jgi:CheY-like chemotaxis protein
MMIATQDSLHSETDNTADKNAAEIMPTLIPNTRILVVEDDLENVALLRAELENPSFSLDFAVNGVEALEKRRRSSHDLILMDMQMPVMDGYTATREIRAWEKATCKRRAPIVALTAHALHGSLGDSMAAGCDAHLTKPVEREILLDAIAEFATPLSELAKPIEGSQPRPVKIPISALLAPVEGRVGGISAAIEARRPAFLDNRWRDLAKLQAGLAAQDFAAMRVIAHNCKGIGTGYGFPEISSIGAQISTAAKAFDTEKLQECLRAFEACLVAASS